MTHRIALAFRTLLLTSVLLIGAVATLGVLTSVTSALENVSREPLTLETSIGKTSFQVEIADTESARSEGLMYRPTLPADQGMLFDFKVSQTVYFWMKNTYVSLDMIFIRADGTVARIAENTTPLSEKTVPSESSVRYVLEVVAGTAARIGLKPGDKVVHRLIKATAG